MRMTPVCAHANGQHRGPHRANRQGPAPAHNTAAVCRVAEVAAPPTMPNGAVRGSNDPHTGCGNMGCRRSKSGAPPGLHRGARPRWHRVAGGSCVPARCEGTPHTIGPPSPTWWPKVPLGDRRAAHARCLAVVVGLRDDRHGSCFNHYHNCSTRHLNARYHHYNHCSMPSLSPRPVLSLQRRATASHHRCRYRAPHALPLLQFARSLAPQIGPSMIIITLARHTHCHHLRCHACARGRHPRGPTVAVVTTRSSRRS